MVLFLSTAYRLVSSVWTYWLLALVIVLCWSLLARATTLTHDQAAAEAEAALALASASQVSTTRPATCPCGPSCVCPGCDGVSCPAPARLPPVRRVRSASFLSAGSEAVAVPTATLAAPAQTYTHAPFAPPAFMPRPMMGGMGMPFGGGFGGMPMGGFGGFSGGSCGPGGCR